MTRKWIRKVLTPRRSDPVDETPRAGLLARLRRDRAGNTLAIMAAALVPLIGFSGSAVDMARLYVVKVRLQQACDAGALAGRKALTDTSLPAGQTQAPLDTATNTQAQAFFASNFRSGWFNNANAAFNPVKMAQGSSTGANAVYATASVDVPMTLMKFFTSPTVTLNVSCQAVYDLADSDIMFVLDTTGSMSCTPSAASSCIGPTSSYTRDDNSTAYYNVESTSGGSNTSKMEALRQAVLLFDSTIRASVTDNNTHFRYGFVPYSSSVNVGGVIPSQYLQSGPTYYQTRTNLWDPVNGVASTKNYDYNYTGNYYDQNGQQKAGTSTVSVTGVPQQYCVPQRNPASGYGKTGPTWNNAAFPMAMYYSVLTWTPANNGTCSRLQQPLRAMWHYDRLAIDTSSYIPSLGATGTSIANPSRLDGSTSKWDGCIEELDTTAGSTFTVGSLPDDLNPDSAPTSSTDKWRPAFSSAEWLRNGTAAQDVRDESVVEDNNGAYYNLSYGMGHLLSQYEMYSCGRAASRLQVMSSQQVHDYLYDNDFRAWGSTYHDIGMIWGTRMLSPDGIFKADTAPWPGRNTPQRAIVFMTDGTMETFPSTAYQAYGVEAWDNRVDGGNTNNDAANHTARFRVECDAAKAKGITIYAVALGTGVTSDMTYCASPGQTFPASDTASLKAAFKTIAQRVAKLRINQ